MEIENNEYIRTKNGTIAKIKDVETEIKTNMFGQILYEVFAEENIYYEVIVKHSKNIIDLIEVGDIVKVYVFADISDDDSEAVETYYRIESKYEITELKESVKMNYSKILSILTKEQYEQNSYKL